MDIITKYLREHSLLHVANEWIFAHFYLPSNYDKTINKGNSNNYLITNLCMRFVPVLFLQSHSD